MALSTEARRPMLPGIGLTPLRALGSFVGFPCHADAREGIEAEVSAAEWTGLETAVPEPQQPAEALSRALPEAINRVIQE
jgi:hypothetical protein